MTDAEMDTIAAMFNYERCRCKKVSIRHWRIRDDVSTKYPYAYSLEEMVKNPDD
jgi:hypothetical protein